MGFNEHFKHMARYNRRMNQQVYQWARQLPPEQLSQDQGAFFGSILGVLNHILVGDLIWLTRFVQHHKRYQSLQELQHLPKPNALNHQMYSDLITLEEVRQQVDGVIVRWLDTETEDSDFYQDLSYSNTKGIISQRNFAELVAHLFNHQTHHRGQVSTLLSQNGVDIGVTDFLIDIPDKV